MLLYLIAGLTLGDLAAPAATQTRPAPDVARRMMRMDTNRDGRISRAEWEAAGRNARGFTRADANHDGYVDREEYAAFVASLAAERQARTGN